MWFLKQATSIGLYGSIHKYFKYWKFQWNKCVATLVEHLQKKNIDLDYEFSNLKLQSISTGMKGDHGEIAVILEPVGNTFNGFKGIPNQSFRHSE